MDPKQTGTNFGVKLTGDEIVISGVSGHFPRSENVQQLVENLYNQVDMVEKIEYPGIKHPELPKYRGKLKNLNRFDSQFFRFTHWQASSFDAMGRKNIEQAYSAIFDAGLNPETLKGTKLGVFIGSSQSDAATISMYKIFKSNGFVMTGSSRTMLANRISYWIDSKGPSYTLDYACASSIACLEIAVERIKAGDCDSAIVGGCNHILHPALSVSMKRAGFLCHDGETKCFDKNGDGYVRSDAVNLMFLQKAKHAKRIYAEVYHVKGKHFSSSDAYFLPSRSSDEIKNFMEEFYAEIDVSPNDVEYVEANATGIAEADKNELAALGKVFGKTKPILVGSIKSNIGHAEPASGICSLTKLCLSYQHGVIPANLHYNEPHELVAIKEGNVQIVTKNTKFYRKFTALNNFSNTGANYHVLLKGHFKPKDLNKYKSSIPYLVLVSGRKDHCVHKILSELENNPIDPEQIGLLNNIFKYNIPGHTGRGYTVIDTNSKNETTCLGRGFELHDGTKRPIWFLYSGMGSQWPTMGADLMHIPIFASTIDRCNKIMQPKDVDIIRIITTDDKKIFDNILHCFVGITAMQIALTEVLRALNIEPDNFIGHSAGEMGCAYADGSLTLEEAMLFSYYRGLVSLETKMIKGRMAAIGLGHNELRKMLPPEIDIACQNSSDSTTISGPAEDVEKFVEYLMKRSVFAKTVATSDIAYHSRYVVKAGPSLVTKMKTVVNKPKLRSKKWLSTCFAPDQWSEETSLYSSAEYFTHNILNTVHFEETSKFIPKNAIVLEIAPHGLMQAIMKRSHASCMNISLTRRGEINGTKHLLKSIGTLYQVGLNPTIDALYPVIEYPISTETSGLSHLVEWDHSVDWHTENLEMKKKTKTISYHFNMSIHDDDYSFYRGCIRNGVNIFPESAVLVLVWKTLAMYNEIDYKEMPVEFTKVNFHSDVIIKPDEILKLVVAIQRGTHFFEVTKESALVASGYINSDQSYEDKFIQNRQFDESNYHLNKNDIYKLMSSRGYMYEGEFQSIKHTNIEMTIGLLKWDNNWASFLDSMFQLNALSRKHNGVSRLKLIGRLVIDVNKHIERKKIYSLDKEACYDVKVSFDNIDTQSGGVLLSSLAFNDIPRRAQITETLQSKQYLPHNPQFDVDLQTALQVNLQIIIESLKSKLLLHYQEKNLIHDIPAILCKVVDAIPLLNVDIKMVTSYDYTQIHKPDVVIIGDLDKDKIDEVICNTIEINKFAIIMNKEDIINLPRKCNAVTKFKIGNINMLLLKKSNIKMISENSGGYYYIPAKVESKVHNVKLINGMSNDCNKLAGTEVPDKTSKETVQVVNYGMYLNDFISPTELDVNVNKYGTGYSGINARGQQVIGIVPDSSVSSVVDAYTDLLWPVPKHWNLEDAATVPLPYVQAYYCLKIREDLRKRSNVFITRGDSSLGQAAITLCLSFDCTVFTTVSDAKSKKMMMKMFGKLDENNIACVCDLHFSQRVLNVTKKKRCDIVFNCETGKARQEAMKVVGPFGTFLDVSEHDMEENKDYGMSFNFEGKSYKSLQLSNIFLPESSTERKKIKLMLSEGIAKGVVRPLVRVTYSTEDISRAFRLLSSTYKGSVLINMKDQDLNITQIMEMSPSKLYMVVCDGTDIGVEFVDHLIQRGAKHILIHIKAKQISGYFHVKYASWKKNDVRIILNSDDLHTQSACDDLFIQCQQLGGSDGIFIAHNELNKDESDRIEPDVANISLILTNLDKASRKYNLSYFVVLVQTSPKYAARCFSEIEICCFDRSKIGLPSLVLRFERNEEKLSAEALSKLYSTLEASLKQNYTSVLVFDSKPRPISYEQTNIHDGLEAIFNSVPEDEFTSTEPVVLMKTLLNNEDENELCLDPDDIYVMMIPGFDGSYKTMISVAERLKIKAVTLQLETDFVTSIPDIAGRLLTIIKKRFNVKSKFYLLGYSFGANVALELASMLEKDGHTGIVFCIDSSPDVMKNHLVAYTGDMTNQQLQNSLIKHFYNLLTGETFEELKEDSATTLEWFEKIDMFIAKTKESVQYTHQFLRNFVNATYQRILLTKDYKPNFKLDSEVVLMKGIPHLRSEILSEDYGLSKYSNKPVKLFNLKADHATAAQDILVSNIINKMLDPSLLECFENKNLCQYYYS